jgi:bacillithiol biosynthesis deacetylase BshB1
MAVDLLVFGPHPDDLEIGLGGTIAHHAALGLRVGLCDLTAGEMGSNGTVDERLAEAEAARVVLGAAWRENLRWADRAIGKDRAHLAEAVSFIRCHQPRVVAVPYWSDRHPDHVAASTVLTEAVFNAGLKRYKVDGAKGGDAWKPDWICYYFINDAERPSFVVDVSAHYERKRQALDCHVSQFRAAEGTAATRLNTPLFRQLIESRDAQFGALAGVTWAEGVVVREPLVRSTLLKTS